MLKEGATFNGYRICDQDGQRVKVFIVVYESGKIIRMKRFRITDDPLSLASDVGGYVQEVVTGKGYGRRRGKYGTAPVTADVLDEEGDIFGEDEDPLETSP